MEKAIFAFAAVPAISAIFLPFAAKLRNRLAETVAIFTLLAGLINLAVPMFSFYGAEISSLPSDCLFLFITAIVYVLALCTALYSSAEIPADKPGRPYFFSLLLISVSLICATVFSDNLFSLFLCLEALGLSAAGMISISRKDAAGAAAASDWLFLYYMPSVFCVAGLSVLFMTLGNLSYESLRQVALGGDPFGPVLFGIALFLTGIAFKTTMFLMPQERSKDFRNDMSVSSHIAICIARFGVMYALFRVALLLRFSYGNANGISNAFLVLGAVIALSGAISACQVRDLKKLACFSDFSNGGLLLMAIGISTPLAVLAAMLLMLGNACGTNLLLICGGISERKKTRLMTLFRSQGSILTLVGGASQSGLPLFAGFWSRMLIAMALYDAEHHVFAFIALISGFFLLVSTLTQRRKTFSFQNDEMVKAEDKIPAPDVPDNDVSALPDRKKEFLLDPFCGNGEKWLKLLPAWINTIILVLIGLLFPFVYMYLNVTVGSLFL